MRDSERLGYFFSKSNVEPEGKFSSLVNSFPTCLKWFMVLGFWLVLTIFGKLWECILSKKLHEVDEVEELIDFSFSSSCFIYWGTIVLALTVSLLKVLSMSFDYNFELTFVLYVLIICELLDLSYKPSLNPTSDNIFIDFILLNAPVLGCSFSVDLTNLNPLCFWRYPFFI